MRYEDPDLAAPLARACGVIPANDLMQAQGGAPASAEWKDIDLFIPSDSPFVSSEPPFVSSDPLFTSSSTRHCPACGKMHSANAKKRMTKTESCVLTYARRCAAICKSANAELEGKFINAAVNSLMAMRGFIMIANRESETLPRFERESRTIIDGIDGNTTAPAALAKQN